MREIAVKGARVRVVEDDVEVDASRAELAAAYDEIRDALDAQNKQRVERALTRAAAVNIGAISSVLRAVRDRATKHEILFHVTKLLAVMENFAGSLKIDTYLDQLVSDIYDEKPTLIAVVAGCRRVRKTCRKWPSIAEVLEAVSVVESDYRSASYRTQNLPKRIEEAEAFLLRSL